MTDQQPTTAGPTVFRIPADRLERARGAQTTLLVLGIVVGGGLVALALWGLGGKNADVVFSLVFGLGGLGILVAVVTAVAGWRRNLRRAAGGDGVVLAVDQGGLALGAFGRVAWPDVSEIVYLDRRNSEPGTGSAAGVGRQWGKVLRDRGGRSEMDVVVTLRDSVRAQTGGAPGDAAGMSNTSNGRSVVRLPFGSALPVEAFHDAYRAVEPVAAAHGITLRYDNKASV
ncbi:hypothetical protein [Agromyces sp. NPDC056965]|uniref:hypothetical protein n=1 Tax=Agromyces sp. NPDC056965 TaxID=3345983 RepID=UPI003638BAB9